MTISRLLSPFKITPIKSGVIIFTIILTLIILKILYPTSSRFSLSEISPQDRIDRIVTKLSSSINDSLPHYEFIRKQDSIRSKLAEENYMSGGSLGAFSFGTGEYQTRKREDKYFLNISGYFAKDNFENYSKDSKNYIEYTVWDKPVSENYKTGQSKTVEVNQKVEQLTTNEWKISFPISKSAYYFWHISTYVLLFFLGIALFYGALYLPLRFLFLIAKGKAFNDETIGCLYTTALILISCGIVSSIIRLGFHLYFKSLMPYPLTFYYYDDVMSAWLYVVTGLAVLLIAKSFLRGSELQEEQDLTV